MNHIVQIKNTRATIGAPGVARAMGPKRVVPGVAGTRDGVARHTGEYMERSSSINSVIFILMEFF